MEKKNKLTKGEKKLWKMIEQIPEDKSEEKPSIVWKMDEIFKENEKSFFEKDNGRNLSFG